MAVTQAEVFNVFPKGVILPWFTTSGSVPNGWSICDGSNGTPDLRRKFLMGVSDMADVGKVAGTEKHSHKVGGTTDDCRTHSDAWGDTDLTRQKTPQCGGLDHKHDFSGSSDEQPHIPPCVTVLYIMKL